MEKVSVIMPCYNGSKYISCAIQSVIEQTYQNWELLVIDDNSTDDSIMIVKKMAEKDTRIKFFSVNSSVGNPSAPRNVGIENAEGRYIAFLDCDDIWYSTKLSKQIPLFEDDKIAIVYSWYEKISDKGEKNNRIIKSPEYVTYEELIKTDFIGNLTGVYDTKKVGKVYQINHCMEDYIMWLNILKKGMLAKCTNTIEAGYRISSDSLSSSKLRHLSWQWKVYREVEQINYFKSIRYYLSYALNGFIKYLK